MTTAGVLTVGPTLRQLAGIHFIFHCSLMSLSGDLFSIFRLPLIIGIIGIVRIPTYPYYLYSHAFFMGDSILRKTDKTLNKGEDVVVCLPGARIEHVTDRVENVLGHGQGGSILVHVGTNNADREGTTRIVQRYRQLVGKLKKTRVEQIILSGILPVIGGRGATYRNCKRMAINALVEQMCEGEGVGFVDLWGYFVGKEDMYVRDGLHLSGKGAAVFSENLLQSMDRGTGCNFLN